jgi:hypothetical protein
MRSLTISLIPQQSDYLPGHYVLGLLQGSAAISRLVNGRFRFVAAAQAVGLTNIFIP